MHVRWFAGAAQAAGVSEEQVEADQTGSIAEVLTRLRPGAEQVLGRCSFLVDGTRQPGDSPWPAEASALDVLPPFAGG